MDRLEISPWTNQVLIPWSKADEFQSNVPKTKRSFNSLANVENEKGDKLYSSSGDMEGKDMRSTITYAKSSIMKNVLC